MSSVSVKITVRFSSGWTSTFFQYVWWVLRVSSGWPLIPNQSEVSGINKLLVTTMTAKPLGLAAAGAGTQSQFHKFVRLYTLIDVKLWKHVVQNKIVLSIFSVRSFVWTTLLWTLYVYCVHNLSEKLSQYDCRVQRADDESWRNFGWLVPTLARFWISLLWIRPHAINPLAMVAPFKAGR